MLPAFPDLRRGKQPKFFARRPATDAADTAVTTMSELMHRKLLMMRKENVIQTS